MSITRRGETSGWYEQSDIEGYYTYMSKDHLIGMPLTFPEFAEVVLLMLEQSEELDEETLVSVRDALATRLNIENETR